MTESIGKGEATLGQIVERIRKYHPNDDVSLVERAYAFAEKAHEGQKRMSGEPYFTHPRAVALILADMMLDSATVAAGLLHDCVEDVKEVTLETIEKQFGSEVSQMVDGVTKLNRVDCFSKEEQQAESIRKMLLATAKEIRVVFIKLADRLHNMRTLKTQKPERQAPIAKETLDIYAPLAHRLGVYSLKWELEDLSFRYIDPEAYYALVERIGMKRTEREEWIASIERTLTDALSKEGVTCEIDGRPKHFYSIYKKMKLQKKTFEQITDLIAVRVIVDTVTECYQVLGLVHGLWRPIPGRIKDYISMPKNSLYQSLHTTVMGEGGKPFEVQIRTREMHRTAEYGVAAHWRYKEGKAADELDEKLVWLRRLLEWQKETKDANEFDQMLSQDLFADEVLVYTPKGDIITLPRGSTPLDFAYRIHTAVGNKCVGAKINRRMMPLTTHLETGDVVEVVTSPSAHGPSRDWLSVVKTSEARTKIRSWLKTQSRDQNLARGREMLEREAKRLGYMLSQLNRSEFLETLFKRYTLTSLDDLYVTVGFGGLSTAQVLNRLIEQYKKSKAQESPEIKPTPTSSPRETTSNKSSSVCGVIVEGDSGMLARFAKCCSPLPGDPIVGYITRGRGISVHRADCANMQDEGVEPERMIAVHWENGASGGEYEAAIQIIAYDTSGLVGELSSILSKLQIPLVGVNARSETANSTANIHLNVRIKDTGELERLIKQLRKRSDIIEIYRASA